MSQRSHFADSKAADITIDGETFEATDLPPEKAGTAADRRDMHRLGKAQEFKRNFSFIPIFGFAAVLMMTWASVLRYVPLVYQSDAIQTDCLAALPVTSFPMAVVRR